MSESRPVPGFPGYEVTSDGRVISRKRRQPRELVSKKAGWYPTVYLCRGSDIVTRTVHSLVAEAFLGPMPEGMAVRHLDGDIQNARLENLAYGRTGRQTGAAAEKSDPGRGKAKDHPLYQAWNSMRKRCRSETNPNYPGYGGRGITVCVRWSSFWRFIDDMGERPSDEYSLDRIDNDGPYSPENCRWATRTEQNRNRRNTRLIEAFGKSLIAADWAKETGVSASVISTRLHKGWPADLAVSTPVAPRNRSEARHA